MPAVQGELERPGVLGLTITGTCNLNCSFCGNRAALGSSRPLMTPAVLDSLLDMLPSVKICRLGPNGESTTSKHFPAIVKRCLERGKNVVISTNGVLAKRIGNSVPWRKLKGVNVSVNEVEPDLYREITGANRLQDVIDTIGYLRDTRANVRVSFVLGKGNITRVKEYLKFAEDTGVFRVTFITYCGGLDDSSTEEDIEDFWDKTITKDSIEEYKEATRRTPVHIIEPWFLDRSKPARICPLVGRRIDVDGAGDLAVCCGGPGPRPEMGNILRDGPGSISSGAILNLRKSVVGPPENRPVKCGGCRYNYEKVTRKCQ